MSHAPIDGMAERYHGRLPSHASAAAELPPAYGKNPSDNPAQARGGSLRRPRDWSLKTKTAANVGAVLVAVAIIQELCWGPEQQIFHYTASLNIE